MKCSNCNTQFTDARQFCANCGASFSGKSPNKNTLIIVAAVLGALVFSCVICGISGALVPETPKKEKTERKTSDASTDAEKPQKKTLIIDVPKLVNKPPKSVEKLLGKPVKTEKITQIKEYMPGEHRNYSSEFTHMFTVRYYKGKAVDFNLYLNEKLSTNEILVRMGIDESTLKLELSNDVAKAWTGTFSNLDYKIRALKKSENTSYDSFFVEQLSKKEREARREAKAKVEKEKSEASIRGKPPTEGFTIPQAADKYLKTNLNDYDDSEYLERSVVVKSTYKGKPVWSVKVKIRAKNAFGAKIIKIVHFHIQHDQVVGVEGL